MCLFIERACRPLRRNHLYAVDKNWTNFVLTWLRWNTFLFLYCALLNILFAELGVAHCDNTNDFQGRNDFESYIRHVLSLPAFSLNIKMCFLLLWTVRRQKYTISLKLQKIFDTYSTLKLKLLKESKNY